jgi:type I restriction-modification system DNA methylase subunit
MNGIGNRSIADFGIRKVKADFEAYLDGFSPNVQDILDRFEFRNQIPRLSKADALGTLIEKFLDPSVNLSPKPVKSSDGSIKYPGLDNHAMGTIFEELVRRFNVSWRAALAVPLPWCARGSARGQGERSL